MSEMDKQDTVEETTENKRKRLIFRSWHRGTKEMDLLMGSFADAHLPDMAEGDLSDYDALLHESDPDLYNWISGREKAPERVKCPVLDLLIGHQYARKNQSLDS
tara:strand:+ start:512 stop:823 length:312 start_codon:yes stop_codon:yes gene_type:complete